MIKRAVALFLVWVALCPALAPAVPAISAVSGTVQHGGLVTLTGTGFGTRPNNNTNSLAWQGSQYLNSRFKDFADGSLTSNGWAIWVTSTGLSTQNGGPSQSGKYYSVNNFDDGEERRGISINNPTGQKFYISFKFMVPAGSQSGKLWRVYGASPFVSIFLSTGGSDYTIRGASECSGGAGCGAGTEWGQAPALTPGTWARLEFVADTVASTFKVYLNSTNLVVNRTDWFPTNFSAFTDQLMMFPNMMDNSTRGEGIAGSYNYTDIFVDWTLARIDLCTGSTFAARGNCETQIPVTWGDTGISTRVNKGALTDGTRYLYVYDATGTPNATGYAVTLGAAADTIAPTVPTVFGAESPDTSSIALSWIKGTDAVGPVTTDIERCTGWGCTTYTSLTNTAASTYTDTGLTSAQIYHYRIRSRDGAGNVSAYVETYFNPRPTIPAFPGAEGAGAASIGGRGGAICRVTNLNDSGAGSLRACTTAQGPRTVVFTVGGTINLQSVLPINNPYITIAGQTAPGGGIAVSAKAGFFDVIGMNTHNIVIRYIRFARGYYANYPPETGDTISMFGPASNIIFDHVAARWANDGNIDIWRDNINEKTNNITVSNSIISEPLGDKKNINFGANGNASETIVNVDMHHNFIYGYARNPLTTVKSFRFVNNIDYNFVWEGLNTGGGAWVDVINNRFKAGPAFNPARLPVRVFPMGGLTTPLGSPSIYVAGNIGPLITDPLADNWPIVAHADGPGMGQNGYLNAQYRRTTALPTLQFPITAEPGTQLESTLLPNVGPSRRLDCVGDWVGNRDAVDIRVLNNYTADTGVFPTDEATVGGLPVLDAGTPCPDTDSDGMPDTWETAQALNPNSSADAAAVHASGYTNIERFIAGSALKPSLSGLLPAAMRPASAVSTDLQTTTDRAANCRYSTVPSALFGAMTPFSSTGGTAHSSTVPIRPGGSYWYYINCQGVYGEISDTSTINFAVSPILKRSPSRRGRR